MNERVGPTREGDWDIYEAMYKLRSQACLPRPIYRIEYEVLSFCFYHMQNEQTAFNKSLVPRLNYLPRLLLLVRVWADYSLTHNQSQRFASGCEWSLSRS